MVSEAQSEQVLLADCFTLVKWTRNSKSRTIVYELGALENLQGQISQQK